MKPVEVLMLSVVLVAAGCERFTQPTQRSNDGSGESGNSRTRSASTTMATTSVAPIGTSPATQPAAGDATHGHERLFGTWVAQNVDSKLGEVKIQVTFRRQGPVKILAWSELPLVGQVRNKQAPYEVNGNTISSDALNGGTSVKYRFADNGQLIIEYADGKIVRFQRQG